MAYLILADGTIFEGQSFGAEVVTDGEVVFNTGMAGYPESMTDPSYKGQILVLTYPLVGNYGVPTEELNEWGFSKVLESENIHVRALVVSQVSEIASHHLAKMTLPEWMKKHGIPGITGIDTRALTKKLREKGVMLGAIRQGKPDSRQQVPAIKDPNLENPVAEASCKEVIVYDPSPAAKDMPDVPTILAWDCGMKRNIIRSFLKRGVRVVRVPWDYDIDQYKGKYQGVFFSNGPGDPKACVPTIKSLQKAIKANTLTFGICLGNQLMGLAIGGDTYKLKYGHRGANQPCVEKSVVSDQRSAAGPRCIITSQNHGFAVDAKTLPQGWHVWWENANDGTVEGIRHESGRFYAVQFHPEATPGPEDANFLFDEFVAQLKSEKV